MRLSGLLALTLCVGLVPAQPISNGSFESPLMAGIAPAAPWVNTAGSNEIGPMSLLGGAPADDGFPTNGAQWLFATSLALGPGTPQPSGGGLPVPGTVGEVIQVFTADGSGTLSFDWTWICGETIPQTFWIDFASVDVIDMGGNNVANLLYVDASTTSAFNNIPGATNGPAGPPVFGLTGSTWNTFGNEVLPLGPKTAAYTGLPLAAGVQYQLVIVAGNGTDAAAESFLYVDNFQPNMPPAPSTNQINLPTASLEFTGTQCSPATSTVRTYAVASTTTMTVGSGPNGEQPYALFATPGSPAIQGPGFPTSFGIADFSLTGYSVLTTVIDGIGGLSLADALLGTTTAATSRSILFGIGSGPAGTTQATYQALVADPTNPSGIQITRATQIDRAFPAQGTPVGATDASQTQIVFTGGLTIPFYGATYTRAWVNDDGYLTFGAPGFGGFGSSLGMLNGPPRIAGAWKDLNPVPGSYVNYSINANSFEVSWLSIPEYPNTGANNFRITITDTSNVSIDWWAMTTPSGVAGMSPGGINPSTSVPYSPVGAATGASLDLSAIIGVGYVGAPTEGIFEEFFPQAWDLNGIGGFSPCLGAGGASITLQCVPNGPAGGTGYTAL